MANLSLHLCSIVRNYVGHHTLANANCQAAAATVNRRPQSPCSAPQIREMSVITITDSGAITINGAKESNPG